MYEALRQTVTRYPERLAYDFMDCTSTYEQFAGDIDTCSNALAALGLKKGDRITISMPTSPQGLICFYAANKLGAVSSMIHPLSTTAEIEYYLNVSKSRFALTLDTFYDKFREVKDTTPLETLILTGIFDSMAGTEKGGSNGSHPDPMVRWWHNLMTADYPKAPKAKMGTDELAAILYSGGTTGVPKGIMLSNYNFITEGMMVYEWWCKGVGGIDEQQLRRERAR
jgi:long-chain acyl-CoA synthetase